MGTHDRRPAWWQLYLLVFCTIGMLVLGAWAPLSEVGHQGAAIGALLLAYGLVALWLRTNRLALLDASSLILLQRPHQKVVRQTPDEQRVPVYVSRKLSLKTEIVAGGNGDHGTDQATEDVAAPSAIVEQYGSGHHAPDVGPSSIGQPETDLPPARRE